MLRNKWLGHLMNLQPIVASVTAILIGMDVFTWDKPAARLAVTVDSICN